MNAETLSLPPGLEDAGQAAMKKFLPVLERKTPDHRKELGFSPEDDLSHLTLGQPFEPRVLAPDLIKKHANKGRVEDLFTGSGRWYFPLVSNGHMVCFVTVAQMTSGSWIQDSIGMSELAHTWSAVCEAWPASKGYTPVLIFAPSHRQFLFSVPQAPYPNLTRLNINAPQPQAKNFRNLEKAEGTLSKLRTQTPSIR